MRQDVDVSDATLASAIGSLAPSSAPTTNEKSAPTAAATMFVLKDVHVVGDNEQEAIPGFLKRCDHQLEPSGQHFEELHNAMQQALSVRDPQGSNAFIDSALRQCADTSVLLPDGLLEQFAGWLADRQRWGALQKLVKARRCTSLHQCPSLLRACAEAERYRILLELMRSLEDATADDLSSFLEALMSKVLDNSDSPSSLELRRWGRTLAKKHCTAAEKNRTSEAVAAATCVCAAVDGFSGVHFVLHAVIACKLDNRVIRSACENLGTSSVVSMLTYLRQWIDRMLSSHAGTWFFTEKWCVLNLCIPKQKKMQCFGAVDTFTNL